MVSRFVWGRLWSFHEKLPMCPQIRFWIDRQSRETMLTIRPTCCYTKSFLTPELPQVALEPPTNHWKRSKFRTRNSKRKLLPLPPDHPAPPCLWIIHGYPWITWAPMDHPCLSEYHELSIQHTNPCTIDRLSADIDTYR